MLLVDTDSQIPFSVRAAACGVAGKSIFAHEGTAIDLGLNEAYNDLFPTQAERGSAQRG